MSVLERIRDYLLPVRDCAVCGQQMTYGDDGREWCPACGYVPCACDPE